MKGNLFAVFTDQIELRGIKLSDTSVVRAAEFPHDIPGYAFGIQLGDVDFTDELFSGIPGEVLRTLIKYENIPLHVGGDDSIHRTGNQILEKFIGLPEFISDSFLVGNVTNIGIGPVGAIGRRCKGYTDFCVSDLAGGG